MTGDLRINDHPIMGPAPARPEVTITFDGRELRAYRGEPIAAALLANGIRKLRTMPGTDESRGVFTAAGRSLEELGTVNGEANVPLVSTPVEDGMAVETQRGLGDWGDSL
jgi:hypothetical protein